MCYFFTLHKYTNKIIDIFKKINFPNLILNDYKEHINSRN